MNATPASSSSPSVQQKYLTFTLSAESYGIPVLKVREIIQLLEITPVPQSPSYMRGIINLRGKVLPVVDLHRKFGLQPSKFTEQTCIVIVQIEGSAPGLLKQMGILVDNIEEVLGIHSSQVEEPPDFGHTISSENLLGVAKVQDSIKILLDIDKVLAG